MKSEFLDPVLFVRWVGAAEASDVPEIRRCVRAAHKLAGDKLVYVAIVPVGLGPPNSEAREALREGTDEAVEMCRSVHVVIEGSGFRRAMMRSISAGLLLAARRGGRGFQIHETVEGALAKAREGSEFDVAKVLSLAEMAGVLSLAQDG